MLDWDGSQWQSIPINTTLGIIDGMGVGNFVGSTSDILLGTRHQVVLYSRTSGPWIPQTLIPSTGAYMTWDADFGSLNELGKIAVAALDQRMVIIRRTSNGTFDASMEVQMPSWIDSIQLGDIDDSRTPCVNAETDSPLAATTLLATPALHELP